MGFRETVREARAYLDAELLRLSSPEDLPATVPVFTVFRGVTLNANGTANVLIEQGHGVRVMDAPIVFVCELARWFGTRTRLNSRGPNKAAGVDNVYPRLDTPGGGTRPRLNMQLNRIVADPGPGFTVRENLTDHRNHLREGLRVETSNPDYGARKSRTTRLDFIDAVLGAFDRSIPATRPFITRDELGDLLLGLLKLADRRSEERVERSAA